MLRRFKILFLVCAMTSPLLAEDFQWDADARLLRLADPETGAWLVAARAQLSTVGDAYLTDDIRYRVHVERAGRAVLLSFRDRQGQLDMDWRLERLEGRRVIAQLTVVNTGDKPLTLRKIIPMVATLPATRDPQRNHVLLSGIRSSGEPQPTSIPPDQDQVKSAYTLALESPALVVGFVQGRRNFDWIRADLKARSVGISAWGDCDGCLLAPGEKRRSDPVLISREPQPLRELERFADLAAKRNNAVVWPPRVAWCTWYAGWRRKSIPSLRDGLEAGIYETIPAITKVFGDRAPQTLRICDDYIAYGDWSDTTAELDDGYTALASRIASGGLIPGVWYPVFWAAADSRVLREHPEWFARASDGDLFKVTGWQPESRGTRFFVVFDASRRDVGDYFEKTARTWRKRGYRYVTNDFMQYGHQPEKYHDPSMTKAEIMYAGMKAVRQGLGDEVFYRTIGAPLGTCMGLSNDVRISGDSHGNNPTAYFRTAQLWFYNRRLWLNDPSAIVCGNRLEKLAWNRMWMSWIALAGTVMTYGEILPELPAEYVEMYRRLFPPLAVAGRPLDIWENDPYRLWGMHPGDADGPYDLVGVFNLSEQPEPVALNLDGVSAACRGWKQPDQVPGEYLVWDFWNQKLLRGSGHKLEVLVPRRAGLLLSLRPRRGRPQLLGTSGHFSQGVVESRKWNWDASKRALTAEVRGNGQDRSTFFFHVPRGWDLLRVTCGEQEVTPARQGDSERVVAIPVEVDEWQPLRLDFEGKETPRPPRPYADGPTAAAVP